MRDIQVQVKTRHYATASRYSSNENCPLAMALKEAGREDILVGSRTVSIGDDPYYISENWQRESGWVDGRIQDAKMGKEQPSTRVTLNYRYSN